MGPIYIGGLVARVIVRRRLAIAAGLAASGWPLVGRAAPVNWQMDFQAAATPVMAQIHGFHWLLLVIITAITLFVLGLLAVCRIRFNARRNPVPSKLSHNTVVEVLWTVLPIMVLIVIAVPSFRLLYYADRTVAADMTIKAIGNQWYWSYVYPDHGDLAFDAVMKQRHELAAGELRLLTTDNMVVVPTESNVRLLVTATDVLHAWAIPAFGVKLDAVPGRLNETWFRVDRPGLYYGQCSELCGTRHGFMPIMVKAVPQAEFDAWVAQAQDRFARRAAPAVTVAAATERRAGGETTNDRAAD